MASSKLCAKLQFLAHLEHGPCLLETPTGYVMQLEKYSIFIVTVVCKVVIQCVTQCTTGGTYSELQDV